MDENKTAEQVVEQEPEKELSEDAKRWREEARKWESRATKNRSEAEKRLKELEDAQKSELEKTLERAQAAEKELEQLKAQEQLNAYKSELAERFNVPRSLIRGASLEELEDHAQELSKHLKQPATPALAQDGLINPERKMSARDEFCAQLKSLMN